MRDQLYESAAIWDQSLQTGQLNLIRAIRDHWPESARTVLDVGCGDGKITRALAERTSADFLGLDGSLEALSRLGFPGILGDAKALPFEDARFDLVMSTDVLEHLPDDVERAAWQELFRVARHWVLVAVPFQECLLEATTRCSSCGHHYHVNWHQRSYDFPDLIERAPDGWSVAQVVLSGEPWSPLLPPEIAFRRCVLDEWSGWEEAVCPRCGEKGQAPTPDAPLPPDQARALGKIVYHEAGVKQFVRSHSEILVIFGRSGLGLPSMPASGVSAVQRSAAAWHCDQDIAANLDPFPQVAKMVRAVDGGFVLQLPVYPGSDQRVGFRAVSATDAPVPVFVEDGAGLLFAGDVPPERDGHVLTLPRRPLAGQYGLLVRLPADHPFDAIALEGGPLVSWLSPEQETPAYFVLPDSRLSVQVNAPLWLGLDAIDICASRRSHTWMLAVRLAQTISACRAAESERLRADRESLRTENAELTTEAARLHAEIDAQQTKVAMLRIEIEAMQTKAARLHDERDRLADELAQVRAERATLEVGFLELVGRHEVRAGEWIRRRIGRPKKRR